MLFRRRGLSRGALALAVVVLVVVAGGAVYYAFTSAAPSGPVGTITIDFSQDKGAPGDPATMVGGGPITGTAQNEVYEGLIAENYQGGIVPDLAVSWTQKSSTDYVFDLRQGVKFQDGTPFNASAVVFNFNRFLNTSSPRYAVVSTIGNVTAVSNYQVEIKLKQPTSDFFDRLTQYTGIASPTAVKKYGSQFGSVYAVGTGPYSFVDWVQNDHITLKANPNYWGPAPAIQTIVEKVVPDPTVRSLQLTAGQAQIIELAPQEAKQLSTQQGFKVMTGLPNRAVMLSFNLNAATTGCPAILNPLVRQAINYAINRTALVKFLELGYAQPAIGTIPPAYTSAWDTSVQVYPFNGDVTKAKQLLTQAGLPQGLKVTIETAPFTSDYVQVTEAVAQQLQSAGINATIKQVDFTTIAHDLLDPKADFCIGYQDWGGAPATATGALVPRYTGGNFWDIPHVNDSTLNGMLATLSTADASQTRTLASRVQSYILQNAYDAVLFYPDVIHGVSNSVQNYKVHPSFWWGVMIFDPVIGADVRVAGTAASTVGYVGLPAALAYWLRPTRRQGRRANGAA